MWCGRWSTSGDPWCGWMALPGYGNDWDQSLETANVSTLTLHDRVGVGTGLRLTSTSNGGIRRTTSGMRTSAVNGGQGLYDGTGGPSDRDVDSRLTDRRRCASTSRPTGSWSDEDGLWPTTARGRHGRRPLDQRRTVGGLGGRSVQRTAIDRRQVGRGRRAGVRPVRGAPPRGEPRSGGPVLQTEIVALGILRLIRRSRTTRAAGGRFRERCRTGRTETDSISTTRSGRRGFRSRAREASMCWSS